MGALYKVRGGVGRGGGSNSDPAHQVHSPGLHSVVGFSMTISRTASGVGTVEYVRRESL